MQHFLQFFILEIYLALTVVETESEARCSWPKSPFFSILTLIETCGWVNLFLLVICVLYSGNANGPEQG